MLDVRAVSAPWAQALTFLLPNVPLEQPTHPAASAGWPSPGRFVQWKSPLALVLIVFKIPSWLRYLIREAMLRARVLGEN